MSETCEDIGQEVLENIFNMDEVMKSIQVCTLQEDLNSISLYLILFKAQNYFYINGQKTLVRITSRGILIHQHSSRNRLINHKKR